MSEIRKDAIVRTRRAGVGDGKSGLEIAMLRAIRAAGLPEPAREWHFDWCCEHEPSLHQRKHPEVHEVSGCRGCYELVGHVSCDECAQGRCWQHDFRHGRQWRFDFAYPGLMIALEVEGGTHAAGRHTRGEGFEEDCEKYAEALLLGWRVLRVPAAMVDDGRALDYLERLLKREEGGS